MWKYFRDNSKKFRKKNTATGPNRIWELIIKKYSANFKELCVDWKVYIFRNKLVWIPQKDLTLYFTKSLQPGSVTFSCLTERFWVELTIIHTWFMCLRSVSFTAENLIKFSVTKNYVQFSKNLTGNIQS